MFRKINEIVPNNGSSWEGKAFLTFDVEWANDDVLGFVLNIIEEANVKATFFVTHETPVLERMRANSNLELGIHPNFNFLLEGDFRYGRNYREVVEHYMRMVPEAVSVRCHALAQQTNLLGEFNAYGLRYDCNLLLPLSAGTVRPFVHFDRKLVRVPFIWEDDVHMMYGWKWNPDDYLQSESIKTFSFHPIHVFLNSDTLERYYACKGEQQHTRWLEQYRNRTHQGVYDYLVGLIEKCKS